MASQSTMDKLHDMRLSVMARAYRDQEELPAASGLSFDERLAMIVDAEWDSRMDQQAPSAPEAGGLSRAGCEYRRCPLR